jgi:hypothetical protein
MAPPHPPAADAPLVVLPDSEQLCVEAAPAPMTTMQIGLGWFGAYFFRSVAMPRQQKKIST